MHIWTGASFKMRRRSSLVASKYETGTMACLEFNDTREHFGYI
jgi:hypothetical protein